MSKHATYIGQLQHLKGKTALLRYPPEKGFVLAQFDDLKLRRSGEPWPQVDHYPPHAQYPCGTEDREEPPYDALAYGWHAFPEGDFQLE